MSGTKVYLGDAVYAEYLDNTVILTAEDGVKATDTIYLEPQVFNALVDFVKKCRDGK